MCMTGPPSGRVVKRCQALSRTRHIQVFQQETWLPAPAKRRERPFASAQSVVTERLSSSPETASQLSPHIQTAPDAAPQGSGKQGRIGSCLTGIVCHERCQPVVRHAFTGQKPCFSAIGRMIDGPTPGMPAHRFEGCRASTHSATISGSTRPLLLGYQSWPPSVSQRCLVGSLHRGGHVYWGYRGYCAPRC